MTLALRISEERDRLAAAKERLRTRQLGRGHGRLSSSVASVASAPVSGGSKEYYTQEKARSRVDLSTSVSSNRRFDYRSPKSTNVSVKVFSSGKSKKSAPPLRCSTPNLTMKTVAGRLTVSKEPPFPKSAAAREIQDLEHVDGEFARRLRQMTSREAALSARAKLAEDKLAFAEVELTAKTDMYDMLQMRTAALKKAQQEGEAAVRTVVQERNEAVSQREIARQRVYGMSERVGDLEQALERYKQEALSTGAELSALRNKSENRVGALETELEGLRKLLGDSEAAVVHKSQSLTEADIRVENIEAQLKKASDKARTLEMDLTAEKNAHSRVVQKLSIIETELVSRKLQFERAEKTRSLSESASRDKIAQLEAELAAGLAREEGLVQTLQVAENQVEQSRMELHDRLKELESSATLAKTAEKDKLATEAKVVEKMRLFEVQIARNTLEANARLDAANTQIEDLSRQLEHKSSTPTVISPLHMMPPPPSPPPIDQTQRDHEHFEEVVIDVDLPDGTSAELLLRPEDNPHVVVATFVQDHNLAPHTAETLQAYVFAQLCIEPAAESSSPTIQSTPLYFFEKKEHDKMMSSTSGEREKNSKKINDDAQSKLRQRLNNLREQRVLSSSVQYS